MRATLLLVLLLAACGSKTPAPVVVANATPDAGAAPVLAAGCPAAWPDATGTCDAAAQNQGCTYPEGSCWCGFQTPCTGMMLPDDYFAGQTPSWQCNANPPAVRADGCPGQEPSGACAKDGQQCTYGSCCVTTVECQGGQWAVGMASCPP